MSRASGQPVRCCRAGVGFPARPRSGQGTPAPALPGAAGPSRAAGLVAGPTLRGRRGRDPHAAHGLDRGAVRSAPRAGPAAAGAADASRGARAPAGTYRLKARRLLDFTRWLLARFGGDFRAMRRAPLGPLRRERPGLGPETADAILLYAAGRPVFVADAYTRRVLARHRLMPRGAATRRRAVPRGPPALRSRALQRVPRAAGGRRQDALPHRTALRLLSAAIRPRRPPAGGLRPLTRHLQQQVDESIGRIGDGQRPRALAHVLEASRVAEQPLRCARAARRA